MAEAILITKTNVATYREIDPKITDARFNAFVNEAQRKNLRGLLGDALYYAFMNDSRASGIYADLLNGTTYTFEGEIVYYYGLIPLLCYWYLAIAAREGDLFHSNVGAIQFVNNVQQSFETAKQKEQIAQNYMDTANDYANGVRRFLNENSETYPLWESMDEASGTEFTTFRA